MAFVNHNPRRLSLTPSGCQNFLLKIPRSLRRRWPPQSPCRRRVLPGASVPSSSPPRSLRTVVPNHGRCPYVPPSSLTWFGGAVDNPGLVPKPATPFPRLQQRRPPRARDAVHPVPFSSPRCRRPVPSSSLQRCRPPWAHDIQSPWRHRTRAVPEPAMSSSSPSLQGYIVYISLWPTNPDFDMLHCHIAFICHIAFVLLYYFDMLHCIFFFVILGLQVLILIYYIAILLWCGALLLFHHIALICYIVTFLWYATLFLFCCIALMCYIITLLWYATLPLTCRIALICYIAFDMLHCFGMLYCFDMLHCHIAQRRKLAKWDECGNMDQHYCTIKISALNNIKEIGHSIKLKIESI
jgi:hypothetical protein